MKVRAGQTMVEYVLALCAMTVIAVAAGYLVSAVKSSAVRTESLVRSDYP